MNRVAAPLLAVGLLVSFAAPGEARRDQFAVGFGGGASQQMQPSVAAQVRWITEDVLEFSLGMLTRDLAILPGQTYGLQTSGLTAACGLHLRGLSLGFQAEAALLRNVRASAADSLQINQGVGFVGEPYIGLGVAGLIQITGYYPLVKPDPGIGPRVMATLWFD